jgi:oxygen-dependent protoporphyrinogen oxidase
MAEVVVIGAGATGLACAHALKRAGVDVVCVESAREPGGIMRSAKVGPYLFEAGPNTIPASAATFRRLAGEAGIADRMQVSRKEASLRLIHRNGQLHPVPMRPADLLRTKLLSWPAKLRLASEPLRHMRRVASHDPEPTLAEFMRERLGPEAATTLGGAFVRGVYAAELEELGARSAFPRVFHLANDGGGIVRGMLQARRQRDATPEAAGHRLPGPATQRGDLLSFPSGLGELSLALARGLTGSLLLGRGVVELERGPQGWRVSLEDGADLQARVVVLTTSPADAHGLLALATPERVDLDPLFNLPTGDLTVVHLGLSQPRIPPAFGFLVPPDQRPEDGAPRLLGALFPSNIFSGRAPGGHATVSAIYRTGPEVSDAARALETAREDLRRGLGHEGGTVEAHRIDTWRAVIPRYGVGHVERMETLHTALRRALPGLVPAGTWTGGVSVEDRLKTGLAAASQARQLLGKPQEVPA